MTAQVLAWAISTHRNSVRLILVLRLLKLVTSLSCRSKQGQERLPDIISKVRRLPGENILQMGILASSRVLTRMETFSRLTRTMQALQTSTLQQVQKLAH